MDVGPGQRELRLHAVATEQLLRLGLTGQDRVEPDAELVEQHALEPRSPAYGMVAVLFCDIDAFKNVNDEYGHRTGDELLRIIAQRFTSVVRPEDTVARIGGDEFVVLIDSASSVDDIAVAAARMRSGSRRWPKASRVASSCASCRTWAAYSVRAGCGVRRSRRWSSRHVTGS